jgi:hypothetical protein
VVTSFQLPYVLHAVSILLRCLWNFHFVESSLKIFFSIEVNKLVKLTFCQKKLANSLVLKVTLQFFCNFFYTCKHTFWDGLAPSSQIIRTLLRTQWIMKLAGKMIRVLFKLLLLYTCKHIFNPSIAPIDAFIYLQAYFGGLPSNLE